MNPPRTDVRARVNVRRRLESSPCSLRASEPERSDPGTREAENRVDRDGTAHARVAPRGAAGPARRALATAGAVAPPARPGVRRQRGGRAGRDGDRAGPARLVLSSGPGRAVDPARAESGGGPRVPGRPGGPSLAIGGARRAVAGHDPGSLSAGHRPDDRRRPAAPGAARRAGFVGVAGDGAAGRPPGVRPRWRDPTGGVSGTTSGPRGTPGSWSSRSSSPGGSP